MADQAEQVSTSGLVDTKQPGATKRRQYPEALKRQMVAETQARGALVSIVARRHDVNSNQLFRWRRQLLPADRAALARPQSHGLRARCHRVRYAPAPPVLDRLDRREAAVPARGEVRE